jgi:beta-lactamase class A
MSTMKIAILEELYRKLDEPPNLYTVNLITQTMSLSGNMTANELLAIIGDGDATQGTRVMNSSFGVLGLKNTFMATPYDKLVQGLPRIVTPANSRSDINTLPDWYIQTTPRDMGLMLAMIVQCSEGGGTLIAAYSGQVTPEECRQALEFMSLNEVEELIRGALPKDVQVIHKHGYAAEQHGDVAVVWSPRGAFVLAIFLRYPDWLEWTMSNGTFKDLTTAVWNYYNLPEEVEATP